MQSATFIDKDIYPSPVPGGEFCTVVKQITFMIMGSLLEQRGKGCRADLGCSCWKSRLEL